MTYCSSSNKELISSDELYCLVLLHPVRGLHTNPRGLVVTYTSDAGSAAITTNKNRTEGLRLSWQHLSPADRPPVRNIIIIIIIIIMFNILYIMFNIYYILCLICYIMLYYMLCYV